MFLDVASERFPKGPRLLVSKPARIPIPRTIAFPSTKSAPPFGSRDPFCPAAVCGCAAAKTWRRAPPTAWLRLRNRLRGREATRLAQVRHGRGRKSAKCLRISSGCRRVYTTCLVEFQAIRKAQSRHRSAAATAGPGRRCGSDLALASYAARHGPPDRGSTIRGVPMLPRSFFARLALAHAQTLIIISALSALVPTAHLRKCRTV